MVSFDVPPGSIGLDGRHTPKITKGWRGWEVDEGKKEGWSSSEAIDKAGTRRLIKIYSSLPLHPLHRPPASAGLLVEAGRGGGGGENVISELLLPGSF